MASRRWSYNRKRGQYRDKRTGRFIGPATDARVRDDFNSRRRKDSDNLARQLADERLSVQGWEDGMRKLIDRQWTAQYLHGKGGRNNMTAGDRAQLRQLLREQYDYLRRFAIQIQAGDLSPAQIRARAQLYLNDSVRAYSMAHAAVFGLNLPAHPGDGTSECLANCKCHWDIEEREDDFACTWQRTLLESCATCTLRGDEWAPLVLSKPTDQRQRRVA